jgi:hypothetical protein
VLAIPRMENSFQCHLNLCARVEENRNVDVANAYLF